MNVKSAILLRVRIVFIPIVLISLAIMGRIFVLQWVQGDEWRKKAEQKQLKQDRVKATRGNIYGDDGALLATSLPFYRVAFDPGASNRDSFAVAVDSLSLLLSRSFGEGSPQDYRRKLVTARREGKRFMYLSRKYINYQTRKQMLRWPLFRAGKIKGGVIFEKRDVRYLPFFELAKRTVGYLNENSGGAGLELSYNKQLAGVDGISLFRRMSGGYWKPIYEEQLPVEGLDIQTTIDVNVQDVSETALKKALEFHRADYGCVVVMEVATGKIKAMANLGLTKDGSYAETYNYAVKHSTEPGSTFKLASYMALLEDGSVNIDDSVFCEHGTKMFYERPMHDAHEGGYGNLTVKQAFEKSSNIAVAKLTVDHFRKTPQRYLDYLDQFGLTTNLEFQMKGATESEIKKLNDPFWSGTTLPWMSTGYEVKVTPLQTLTFYNAVANGGNMIQPVIVEDVRKAEDVKERFEPKVLKKDIASDKTLAKVRQMLEGVVENGTASNIKHADYKIAGKTGTACRIVNKVYTNHYYTSFCGYFPAENPKYSAIVVIDNPQGYNMHGADVAAPVFKEVADKIYARDVEMHKELESVSEEYGADKFPLLQAGNFNTLNFLCNRFGISNHAAGGSNEWVKADIVNRSVTWRSKASNDVRGMMLKDALYLLENKGMRVEVRGHGRVKNQSIEPGIIPVKGMGVVIELES
ncbi:MAG: penicillin-binding protein [Bacteroidota bacterium]